MKEKVISSSPSLSRKKSSEVKWYELKSINKSSTQVEENPQVKFCEKGASEVLKPGCSTRNVKYKLSNEKFGGEGSVVEEKSDNNEKLCKCGSVLKLSGDKVWDLVDLFEHVHASGLPNYAYCRIPLPHSNLNISAWREKLKGYEDEIVCEYLEYGFPLDVNKKQKLSYDERRNHKGARDYPQFIDKYFHRECTAGRVAGPFRYNPLSVSLVVSPMNSVPKSCADERRVIVDLSWPSGASVNDGISKDVYLGELIELHYASVKQVCEMVLEVGPGAHIYKRDLRHAYRQIPVDPADYRYLGYFWQDMLYFDSVLAMGQRNAAMACSRTTNAVIHIHKQAGYKGTNYLDDLIGVASPRSSDQAYHHLELTLSDLGLSENFTKACAPACMQVVLGIEVNTVNGTLSVPDDKMKEIKPMLKKWQRKVKSTKTELQSLIGSLQFISKCVLQSRVFMNRLLETLRSMSKKKSIKLGESFKKDVRWWARFIEDYNGVSFIPAVMWMEPDVTFATDSCLKGCGGIYFKEYFHVSFPQNIMDQQLPIHKLEMLAVLLAVRIWGRYCGGMKIQIYCDNEACVQVINSSRTKDSFFATCLRELWLEVATFGFELRAVHLPGEENRVPDWLSRWEIHPNYQELFRGFMGDEIDQYKEILILPEMFQFSGNL